MHKSRTKGFVLVIIGAFFWGVGGTVSKRLFQEDGIDVNWLVATRLLIAGFLLLAVQFFFKERKQIWAIWKSKSSGIPLVIFGLIGMLGVQYTYMASIHDGNAAVATLLQYLAPVMILIYLLIRKETRFRKKDFFTVFLALSGCFFLLTNGSLSRLSVPLPSVIWGVLSGVALAFYTLYAVPLLKKFDSLVVVGWAMLIGGAGLSVIHPPWAVAIHSFHLSACFYLFFVIVLGTMLAFWFYIESLQSLSPHESSLLGSIEPLAAVFTTVFWLHAPFGLFQWIGTACLIGLIVILAWKEKEVEQTEATEPPLKTG